MADLGAAVIDNRTDPLRMRTTIPLLSGGQIQNVANLYLVLVLLGVLIHSHALNFQPPSTHRTVVTMKITRLSIIHVLHVNFTKFSQLYNKEFPISNTHLFASAARTESEFSIVL
ncbi:hypothetical protein LSTR_LSTR005887 [Laodelphax striatellus]|uniref:Uncharacterized protein n=1 Tax=Laodelphax striatellus TaxID=195883 RepID=A0A482WSC4_LAOST|nr:hypothetical protein LSTR_LSTR005887 [Laodelphax striatellus]